MNTLKTILAVSLSVFVTSCQKQVINTAPIAAIPKSEVIIHDDANANQANISDVIPSTQNQAEAPEQITVSKAPTKPLSIWELLTQDFKLNPHYDHTRVQQRLKHYLKQGHHLNIVFNRARTYMPYILELLESHELPGEIALLPIIESGYDPFAYSHQKASGLWQMIPPTAKYLGLEQNWWFDARRDIHASTLAAIDYLKYLHERFDGDWLLALAAYNAGEGTIKKAQRVNKRRNRPVTYWHLPLPRETKYYIPKLLGLAAIIKEHEAYKLELPNIPSQSNLVRVDVDGQIDLNRAAENLGMTLQEFYSLNPGFNRWASQPDDQSSLLIPQDKLTAFNEKKSDFELNVKLKRYKVKNGDSLIKIANTHNTKATHIKTINQMSDNFLRAGDYLLVPVKTLQHDLSIATLTERYSQDLVRELKSELSFNYKIKRGDSLWKIAKKHDVSINQLTELNRLTKSEVLRAGSTVKIPQKRDHNGVLKKLFYTVRSGDSLSIIASRYKVSVEKLCLWNEITPKEQHRIKPGEMLTLFVDVTKQSG